MLRIFNADKSQFIVFPYTKHINYSSIIFFSSCSYITTTPTNLSSRSVGAINNQTTFYALLFYILIIKSIKHCYCLSTCNCIIRYKCFSIICIITAYDTVFIRPLSSLCIPFLFRKVCKRIFST